MHPENARSRSVGDGPQARRLGGVFSKATIASVPGPQQSPSGGSGPLGLLHPSSPAPTPGLEGVGEEQEKAGFWWEPPSPQMRKFWLPHTWSLLPLLLPTMRFTHLTCFWAVSPPEGQPPQRQGLPCRGTAQAQLSYLLSE